MASCDFLAETTKIECGTMTGEAGGRFFYRTNRFLSILLNNSANRLKPCIGTPAVHVGECFESATQ